MSEPVGERIWEPEICFVETAEGSPPGLWFENVGQGLGGWLATLTQVERGLEPKCDIYVVERELWRAPIARWRVCGARIFVWLDDAFGLIPLDFDLGRVRTWREKLPILKRLLGKVDGVILPNALLAADFAPFARQAYFIPNYHHLLRVPVCDKVSRRWGWGGTTYHLTSWRETRFYEHIPADVTFRVIGDAQFGAIARPYCKTEPLSWMSYTDYLSELATWECCLIPLNGEYDMRRSQIKALECCLVGTPWLAIGDAADIYRGVPGGAWYLDAVGLEGKVADARSKMNPAAVEWAKHQHIDEHVQEWKDALYV